MRSWAGIVATFAALSIASAAGADCTVSSDPGAVARPLDAAVQADANLIVSMTMLPRLMHVDYAQVSRKPACALGTLPDAAPGYALFGDDKAGRRRVALSDHKGEPVAVTVPFVDVMKALAASKEGKSVSTDGYVLAVVTPTTFTGWRYYTAMPDPAVLKRDMADALAGRGSPLFRNETDGKTSLFVPHG